MTAVHQSAAEERGGLPRKPSRWPLLSQPSALVAYVGAVVGLHVLLIGFVAARTHWEPEALLTFGALMACGAICIEASRRLGMPAGVARDMLSAWWLPVALLLPPVYALLMPIPVQALLQLRVRRTLLYRRALVSAAYGLAGAAASAAFHVAVPDPLQGRADWLSGLDTVIPVMIVCALVFTVTNTAIVAVAAHGTTPGGRWREVLWNREQAVLDVAELCVGVLVTIACALTPVLLLVALPPVMLLQRGLMHQQLQAAARTDAKTGLLNAAAWQREADTEISRALRTDESLALLLIDIDHFKRVNDTYGHLTGDQVLIGVAGTLVNQLRDYDVVGRFGGEEFVVLLPHADTLEACRVAERLRQPRTPAVGSRRRRDGQCDDLGGRRAVPHPRPGSAGAPRLRRPRAVPRQAVRARPDLPARHAEDLRAQTRRPEGANPPRRVHHLEGPRLKGMPEYIYTMQRVRKAHGDKVILDDVTLSFLPGAKIGVVGPNGTGKSTLLRMMAGLEQASNGDARLMPGFTRRHAAAGAAAERGEDRPRQRRGGRRRDEGDARPVQRGRREDGDRRLPRAAR